MENEQLNISDRLKIASLSAKNELLNKEPPPSTLEIIGEENTSITIKDKVENGVLYFVIRRGTDGNSPIIKVRNDKFRSVYFEDLFDCRVFVMTKLVRVFFKECQSCQISIRQPVVGMVEFFKCTDTNVNIRVTSSHDLSPIPLTRLENCQNFHIFQSNNELIYIVKLCENVTGTIVNFETNAREITYNLGKLFWNEEEQNIVCLSREEGFEMIPLEYYLNDIEHMILPMKTI